MRMRSIRQRLTWTLMAGLAALMIMGGAVLYPAIKHILFAEFDSALLAKARALTQLAEPGRDGMSLNFTERPLPEFEGGPQPEYYQVWMFDGSVQARSPSLGDLSLPRRAGPETNPVFWNLTLPGRRPGRAAGLGFIPLEDDTGVAAENDPGHYTFSVVFARDTVELHRTLKGLLGGLALGGLVLLLLVGWVVRRATRKGLQPVDALAEEVTRIDANSLTRRFQPAGTAAELNPIVDQLNRLMDRLENAFQREKQFTANAAHELLTPVAELRTLAEAAQRWRDDPEISGRLPDEALELAQRMEHMLSVLLALARTQAGLANVRSESVDLAELLEELRACFKTKIAAKNLDVACSVSGSHRVRTDRELVRSILFNLLDNAVEYTPAKGRIECEIEPHNASSIIRIANTNDSLTEAELTKIFEPLWRKDAARTGSAHTGLGLALVKSLSDSLGLRIEARLLPNGMFGIALEFT